jgi:hypothetical protein
LAGTRCGGCDRLAGGRRAEHGDAGAAGDRRQTTAAFGGTILDSQGKPQFATPGSPGYKAAQWMVDALKQGLVPPGNINVTDSQGQQTLMAHGQVASVFGDYSGNVGSLYDVPSSSTVVKQVTYLPTPGVAGPGPNLSNPDGVGIVRPSTRPRRRSSSSGSLRPPTRPTSRA